MKRSWSLSRPFDVSKVSYGGNQMWYEKKFQLQTGCGPVALANLFAWSNGMTLDQREMLALQEAVSRYLRGPVVIPWQFIRGARHLFQRDGFQLDPITMTLARHTREGRERAIGFIAAALSADDPPVMLMGPNRPGATYRRDFKNHWVMITELRVHPDHAELTVSSWGQSFTVDLDRLIRSKLFISLVALRVTKLSPGTSGHLRQPK